MTTRAKRSNLHRAAARTLPSCATSVFCADAARLAPLHRKNLTLRTRNTGCPQSRMPNSHNAPASAHN
jgi:hypothetical protein